MNGPAARGRVFTLYNTELIRHSLRSRNILLGIACGITAYKSIELVRLLKKAGAQVCALIRQNASQFVTPLNLQAVPGTPVRSGPLNSGAEAGMGHIALARRADQIVVAPVMKQLMW